WTQQRTIPVIILILTLLLSLGFWYAHKYYKAYLMKKARYINPVDYSKLPSEGLEIGRIAETKKKAFINPKELTAHSIVAGSTGAGKSVSASIIAEACLNSKIPVIVFDPTAQWTGFVKACKDKDILKKYKQFNMKDPKPFKGLIYEITRPDEKLSLKEYMHPGEITVFVLNRLTTKEYDAAVVNIINSIFGEEWEESPELKLLVVFDEVHRLLKKYGGEKGYLALEQACREFRKWGIGLVMCSQVTADFKEAVAGNILTEIQMNTKSMSDIDRISLKYGKDYAAKITKQDIGTGMIQNPRYNEGKPYFISFRPPLHSPHKILDADLNEYMRLTKDIKELEGKIKKLSKDERENFELELRLAKDKLKTGRFRVTEIYLEGVRKRVDK
ncbi:MAG: DUF853 family protein, partial [Candidatus Aenigmarchaeota archaeon]|nr:DUF853 family protein [Candidatus Aenigmarchaeota archaeon]